MNDELNLKDVPVNTQDENKSTTKNSSYGTLMKTIVLSIYIICVTYSAVHFNNAYILWWLLPILLT